MLGYYCYFDSQIGPLLLIEQKGKLTHLLFTRPIWLNQYEEKTTSCLKQVIIELTEYFAGKRTTFTTPISLTTGTPFQRQVWKALRNIPYGTTISYQELAIGIGNPKACRAVGSANHHNPISIIIPCHRVIGKNQTLTGYAGGLDSKEYLLALEANNTINFC